MSFGEQLIAWRRELHQNPELSGQEVETTARLRQWLTNAGIAPQPYDLSTGLVAEIGTGSRLVALRADIDALPIEERSGVPFSSQHAGVMHACGHDIHTSVILGAALKLKEREASLNGRVRILFQPAEENFGGAKSMVRAGALRDVSAIFGMHNEPGLPVGEFATRGGPFYANIFRDFFAGIRDIVGGRSGAYEKELRKARDIAFKELGEQAKALGADAVVGIDIDYETVGKDASMLMVSVSGTAVKTRR